jgi:hypothetical protein
MHRFTFIAYLLCLAGCGGSSGSGNGSDCGDITGSYSVTSRPDKSMSNTCTNKTDGSAMVDVVDIIRALTNGEGKPHVIQVSDDGDGKASVTIPGYTMGYCPGQLTKCSLEISCDATDPNGRPSVSINYSWIFHRNGFEGGTTVKFAAGSLQADACEENTLDTGAKR